MTPTEADHNLDLERATALCELGRFKDAEQLMQGVVAQQPQDPDAWCLLAQAQLGNTHYGAALRSGDAAAALAPDNEWPHRLRSIALLDMRRTDLAVEAASTAVRLGPHTWQSHHCLATALSHSKHTATEGIEAALRAVTLAPHETEAYFSLGAAAAAAGRRSQARDAFQHVLALDPQHSGAHHELGRLHLTGRMPIGPKHLAAAASGFATALRADPAESVTRSNLDLVLRTFLTVLSYLIFIAAYLAGRLQLDSESLLKRALPVALLAIPAYFAARFVGRLSPLLRRHLYALVTGRRFATATAAECLAAASLAATAVVPAGARQTLTLIAIASALIGRVLLSHEADKLSQQATGLPPKPIPSTSVLWVLAVALLLVSATAFLAAPGSESVTACLVGGAACLGTAAITFRQINRRRGRSSRIEPR